MEREPTYKIVRMYQFGETKVLKTGLTREEAMAHCRDPETSGKTCSDLKQRGDWFDGFDRE